jgi:predicted secreted protein
MILHGKDLIVMGNTTNGYTPIVACSKSCEIDVSCEVIEKSSVTSSAWREYIAGRKVWTASVSYLVKADNLASNLLRVGNTVTLRFVERDSGAVLEGNAIIKSAKAVGTKGNLTTGSCTFQGTGLLSNIS